jgi:prepilin-type N-terminal cleavage/methylation domain-containing protein
MNKSFTLIEILVVIVVIGVLSAFILVGMSSITSSANIAKGKTFLNSMDNSLLLSRVSQWKLDQKDGAGPFTTPDSWGVNTGTLMDVDNACSFTGTLKCPQLVTSGCPSGNCLSFDGVNDYVDCGSGTTLDITTAITISAWIKTTNSSTVQMMVERAPSPYSSGYNILSSNGQFQGRIYPSSISSTAVLSNGVWHYIVMTDQNITNGWNLYFDGINVVQQNGVAVLTSASSLYIGMRVGSTLPFTGSIDDVRVYNQAIPTSEIQQNYFIGINKLFDNNGITLNEFNQRLTELKTNLVNKNTPE